MSHRKSCIHDATPEVTADSITVRIKDRTVLDSVSLHAAGGAVTGLLGPNGSGKTTLLHVLAGLRLPTAGTVHVDTVPVRAMSHRVRARTVALVEQHATTASDLTVRQVVTLGRLPHRGRLGGAGSDPDGEAVVSRSLDLVGLEAFGERAWSSLSGGERQRAHLARTLAQEPQVLLLDEPTNHLDLGQQLRFLALARDLGLTVIAALHDLELAVAHCDDLVVLERGRVHSAGAVAQTMTSGLLTEVYGVEATVEAHPRLPRPHIVWDAPVLESR